MGVNSTASDKYSFVWSGNGKGETRTNNYTSRGDGSFCIDPDGGVSNFWIGDKNLSTIIDEHSISTYSALTIGARKVGSTIGAASLVVGAGSGVASGGSSTALGY